MERKVRCGTIVLDIGTSFIDGLHAGARWRGVALLRRALQLDRVLPRARGLALCYTLSPAARACPVDTQFI